jgi:hypothetical protein
MILSGSYLHERQGFGAIIACPPFLGNFPFISPGILLGPSLISPPDSSFWLGSDREKNAGVCPMGTFALSTRKKAGGILPSCKFLRGGQIEYSEGAARVVVDVHQISEVQYGLSVRIPDGIDIIQGIPLRVIVRVERAAIQIGGNSGSEEDSLSTLDTRASLVGKCLHKRLLDSIRPHETGFDFESSDYLIGSYDSIAAAIRGPRFRVILPVTRRASLFTSAYCRYAGKRNKQYDSYEQNWIYESHCCHLS